MSANVELVPTLTVNIAKGFAAAKLIVQEPLPRKQQIIGLDALRFLAAFWVVLYHLGFWDFRAKLNSHAALGFAALLPPLEPLAKMGWLGVPFFFVISGFVISYSAERATAWSFAVGRAIRLVPAMWICATVTLAISVGYHHYKYSDLLVQYAKSVFFWPYPRYLDDSAWTLWIEISFYVSVWLLLLARRFNSLPLLIIVIGCLSTLYHVGRSTELAEQPIAALLLKVDEANPRLMELLLVKYGLYFSIGSFLWLWLLKGRAFAFTLPWLMLFFAGACLHLSHESVNQARLTGISTSAGLLIVTLGGFLVLFALLVRGNARLAVFATARQKNLLRKVGLMTYPLYLLHQMAGAYLLGSFLRQGNSPALSVCLVIMLAVASSWLVATHIEPPLQRFMRSRLLVIRPLKA